MCNVMTLRRLVVAAALAWVVLGVAPAPTRAYTQRFTVGGLPVRWSIAQVPMRVDPTLGGNAAESLEAGRIAFGAWGGIEGVPVLALEGETQRAPGYAPAGTNENGAYRVARLPIGGTALAVTVSTYRQDDGVLLDADILVEDSRNVQLIAEPPAGRDRRRYDLASLLTHESGHVLGLGESMDDPAATMWPRLALGETAARTIAADDEAGVRAIYADEMLDAPFATGAGCGVSGGGARASWRARTRLPAALFALLVLGLAMSSRRRTARRALVVLGFLIAAPWAGPTATTARADAGIRGVARSVATRWEGGLLVTDVEIDSGGVRGRLTVPGGARDGLVQRVGDALPPVEGTVLRLAPPDVDGARRWETDSGGSGFGVWRLAGPSTVR